MKSSPELLPAAPINPNRQRRPKWHLVYFLLAFFDVFTVCVSLLLNHQIMRIYTHSVEINQKWAGRLGDYSELGQLAAAVNAPGNDVFDSHNVEIEIKRMRMALRVFDERMATVQDELRSNLSSAQAAPLLNDLEPRSTSRWTR
ncbi:MAG: hypothetical protein ABR501_06430 [Pyrinomonadaceae bacterium]